MLHQPVTINILGHATGALIFTIFLVLLYGGRGWTGGGRYLSGLAASLSLVWNVGSLVVLALPGLPGPILDLVVAISFSVLSLLPAVLLHISLEGKRRTILTAGYLLSFTAVCMHFWEIRRNGAELHQRALLLITVGFLALTAVVVVRSVLDSDFAGRSGGMRVGTSMCLALFATSFVHFGTGHASQPWASELLVHHAGIPLALFVLLQDDRFVLLDAFVRYLANALLAAILAGLYIGVVLRPPFVSRPDSVHEIFLLISICLLLVVFAWLRSQTQSWLTHAIFRHGGLAHLPGRVKDSPSFSSEEQYVDWATDVIAAVVRTKDHLVVGPNEMAGADNLHQPTLSAACLRSGLPHDKSWAEVIMPIRLGPDRVKIVLLGRRKGGQRYLSEDLEALARTSREITERVEAIKREEMKQLVAQAELRALQAQINPHFLFNAFNTLYGTIPREAGPARRMVLNLAEVFRYFLRSDKNFVPLSEEMEIVRAYLEVEQFRLGDRVRIAIDLDEATTDVSIPVLSIQPLVENAIKHGVAQSSEPGYVLIRSELLTDRVRISVENSNHRVPQGHEGAGIGLQNVRRRLEICYGSAADLRLTVSPVQSLAELEIPAMRPGGERVSHPESITA